MALGAFALVLPGPVDAVAPASSHALTSRNATVVRAALPPGKINHIFVIEFENEGYQATFGPGSSATYLNRTLRKKGELLANYYAIGHNSLPNYIAQVSGQSPTEDTQSDCADGGFVFADVRPGTADAHQDFNPGQVDGEGCVYPSSVQTIAGQLDARYPPNRRTHVASWRGYDQDMGNTPSRDGGAPDPTGGTDCAHPAIGAVDATVTPTATDGYADRHNPFVWFHSVIDHTEECDANVVPLGNLGPNGQPLPTGHLARDLRSEKTTPRFAFITPNLNYADGLDEIDQFLRSWVPLILDSPAYRHGDTLVVITFDEADVDQSDPTYAAACCGESTGPNTHAPGDAGLSTDTAPGGGQIGALLLNSKYVVAGSTDTTGSYNHYSALRSYEDLLGLTKGGTDGQGHLGFAATPGLAPFGPDVFNSTQAARARRSARHG